MKRVIHFSRLFVATAIFSIALTLVGVLGYLVKGFNLGVDFQAGINQTVQLALPAVKVSYEGKGNASFTIGADRATLVFSGADVDAKTIVFDFKTYPTLEAFAAALNAVPQISAVNETGSGAAASSLLVPTYQGNTQLLAAPMTLYRAPAADAERFGSIGEVRQAIVAQGEVSVQQVNPISLQRYIIRLQDDGKNPEFSKTVRDHIRSSLEAKFGADHVVIMSTDYVGARYSESLSRQAGLLVLGTLVMIMLYSIIRFKLQYAIAAVLSILHDALIMVTFVVWTRMEFNTSTIAAILTILGYSINDTIVQFDRVREERRLHPELSYKEVIDLALTITLERTIITTMTTMLAVLSLFIFTKGTLKDFALALLVGMTSGVYSTIFIASSFVYWWDIQVQKRDKKRMYTRENKAQDAKTELRAEPRAEPKA